MTGTSQQLVGSKESRAKGSLWKASIESITQNDGQVEEAKWDHLEQAPQKTRAWSQPWQSFPPTFLLMTMHGTSLSRGLVLSFPVRRKTYKLNNTWGLLLVKPWWWNSYRHRKPTYPRRRENTPPRNVRRCRRKWWRECGQARQRIMRKPETRFRAPSSKTMRRNENVASLLHTHLYFLTSDHQSVASLYLRQQPKHKSRFFFLKIF